MTSNTSLSLSIYSTFICTSSRLKVLQDSSISPQELLFISSCLDGTTNTVRNLPELGSSPITRPLQTHFVPLYYCKPPDDRMSIQGHAGLPGNREPELFACEQQPCAQLMLISCMDSSRLTCGLGHHPLAQVALCKDNTFFRS